MWETYLDGHVFLEHMNKVKAELTDRPIKFDVIASTILDFRTITCVVSTTSTYAICIKPREHLEAPPCSTLGSTAAPF